MLKEGQLILFDNGKTKKAEDLSVGSHKRVLVICDMCNKEVGMEYRQYYNKSKKYNRRYYCKYCAATPDVVTTLRVAGCIPKSINILYITMLNIARLVPKRLKS